MPRLYIDIDVLNWLSLFSNLANDTELNVNDRINGHNNQIKYYLTNDMDCKLILIYLLAF